MEKYNAPKISFKAYMKLKKARKPVASKETDETENKFIDPRAQKYTKRGVESEMLDVEKQEMEDEDAAEAAFQKALMEEEEERKRKKRLEREKYESVIIGE